MKNLDFSIGILSWKGYASLYNSLKSYEENGLNSLTHSKFICLPEYNNEGIKICKSFGYKPILFKKNIGILNGFKNLALNMPDGPLLLLDNDLSLNFSKNNESPIGHKIIVYGTLLDQYLKPIEGALIEIWQANAAGKYLHMKDKNIVQKRMKQFNEDIKHWKNYDFVVINDDLEKCYNEILKFINDKIEKFEIGYDKKNILNHVKKLSI